MEGKNKELLERLMEKTKSTALTLFDDDVDLSCLIGRIYLLLEDVVEDKNSIKMDLFEECYKYYTDYYKEKKEALEKESTKEEKENKSEAVASSVDGNKGKNEVEVNVNNQVDYIPVDWQGSIYGDNGFFSEFSSMGYNKHLYNVANIGNAKNNVKIYYDANNKETPYILEVPLKQIQNRICTHKDMERGGHKYNYLRFRLPKSIVNSNLSLSIDSKLHLLDGSDLYDALHDANKSHHGIDNEMKQIMLPYSNREIKKPSEYDLTFSKILKEYFYDDAEVVDNWYARLFNSLEEIGFSDVESNLMINVIKSNDIPTLDVKDAIYLSNILEESNINFMIGINVEPQSKNTFSSKQIARANYDVSKGLDEKQSYDNLTRGYGNCSYPVFNINTGPSIDNALVLTLENGLSSKENIEAFYYHIQNYDVKKLMEEVIKGRYYGNKNKIETIEYWYNRYLEVEKKVAKHLEELYQAKYGMSFVGEENIKSTTSKESGFTHR